MSPISKCSRLMQLMFVELLRAGNKLAAINYAKEHFPAFVEGQVNKTNKQTRGLL